MSLREEQCNKVCRILDDVLANRPTERDSLIVAVRKAFAEPKRGRWHYSDGKPARIGLSFGVVCDQCGTESEYCTNFCGECGSDMREVTT